MSKTRNPDALIRIGDAIKVLCWETCCPGACCPDGYCVEKWDKFEDVERVDAVQVRHGRWMLGVSLWYCSECGSSYSYSDYAFCPNCGADMRKEGEHEAD